MASSSLSQDKLTDKRSPDDDLENGVLSPQPSLRTNGNDDDVCSEIVRIEQGHGQDDGEDNNGLARIVRTFQVRYRVSGDSFSLYFCLLLCPRWVVVLLIHTSRQA